MTATIITDENTTTDVVKANIFVQYETDKFPPTKYHLEHKSQVNLINGGTYGYIDFDKIDEVTVVDALIHRFRSRAIDSNRKDYTIEILDAIVTNLGGIKSNISELVELDKEFAKTKK